MSTKPSPQAEAVQRGVELLDRNHPGWYNKIPLDKLHMADGDYCVLGHLYGTYYTGLDMLQISPSEHMGMFYGFVADPVHPTPFIDASYSALTRKWKAVIQARRTQHES